MAFYHAAFIQNQNSVRILHETTLPTHMAFLTKILKNILIEKLTMKKVPPPPYVYPTSSNTKAKDQDMVSSMIVNMTNKEIPMWIGWNILICKNRKLQWVPYTKYIEFPPTTIDVVRRKLIRS